MRHLFFDRLTNYLNEAIKYHLWKLEMSFVLQSFACKKQTLGKQYELATHKKRIIVKLGKTLWEPLKYLHEP